MVSPLKKKTKRKKDREKRAKKKKGRKVAKEVKNKEYIDQLLLTRNSIVII